MKQVCQYCGDFIVGPVNYIEWLYNDNKILIVDDGCKLLLEAKGIIAKDFKRIEIREIAKN